jgi:predicted secreted protein
LLGPPSITFYRGLPVVTLPLWRGLDVSPLVAQLRPGGRSWRALPVPQALFDVRGSFRVVVADRRARSTHLRRRATRAGDGAVPYVAYLDDAAPGVHLRRLIEGEWQALPTTTDAGYRGISAQLAPGRGGGMWLLRGERINGDTRYILDGYGVNPPPQLPPEPRPQTVHWWDDGATVQLTKGQPLLVDLDRSNSRSTGYRWRQAGPPARGVLRFVSSRAIDGGQRIAYRAVGNGRTSFVLEYARPGRQRRALETFRLAVRVG